MKTHNSVIKNINITQCSSGISLELSNNNIINNCKIKNNPTGIYVDKSNNNIIYLNTITRISGNGISLYESQKNTVSNNVISNNLVGVEIFSFLAMLTYFASGPKSLVSSNNIISNNDIKYNSEYGIFIGLSSMLNKIKCNNFQNNSCHASFEHLYFPLYNSWNKNYWDDHEKYRPKKIKGILSSMYDAYGNRYIFTWIFFDWHPVKEPYEINIL